MSYKYSCDFLELSKERLTSRIYEAVSDALDNLSEEVVKDKKQLCEKDQTIEALMQENTQLRAENEEKDADVLRRRQAIPIEFVERYAKECASWGEAKPIYDLLVDFADGDRDIKQKARYIKSYHTRKQNKAMVTNYHYAPGATHHDSRNIVSIYEEEEERQHNPKLIGNL